MTVVSESENEAASGAESSSGPEILAERSRRSFVQGEGEVDDSKVSQAPADVAAPPVVEVTNAEKNQANENNSSRTSGMKRREKIQLFALFFSIFLAGWDGGTYGPLIPRLQTYYNVNYTVVSIIFIMNCIGFITGAASNVYLSDRLGLGKVLVIGSVAQVVAYALMAPPLPFPAFCIAFLIDGWGVSIQDAQCNGFVAGLSESSAVKMGIMHAIYGLGAMISPFSATQFAKMPERWSFHFVASTGLATMNVIILVLVFKGKTQEECFREIGEVEMKQDTRRQNLYRQILTQKVVHLLALFSLVYVGVEISLSSWAVSYIQEHRGGGASAGYVSTGFFGGITLGRIALLWVNAKIGERRVMYIYTLFALCFELVAWLVPSLVASALAISLVGFFLGPMYPILMNESGRLLPQWLLTGSIGWIASFGFSGSALVPFITGALAERFGIVALQPLLLILMAMMLVLWFLVPYGSR